VVKSGKDQYKKINRKIACYIDFRDEKGNFITSIDIRGKKFMMRRHTLFKLLSGKILGAFWSVGWDNSLFRKPTVFYINEEDGKVEKHNRWLTKKPIRMDCEK
jgi:hypothetical protein